MKPGKHSSHPVQMWTQSLHTVDAGHAGGMSSEERSVARWYDDVIEIKDLTKWGCCRQGANEKTTQVDGLRRRRRGRGWLGKEEYVQRQTHRETDRRHRMAMGIPQCCQLWTRFSQSTSLRLIEFLQNPMKKAVCPTVHPTLKRGNCAMHGHTRARLHVIKKGMFLWRS